MSVLDLTQPRGSHTQASYWKPERWPDFSPSEFACRHCGQGYDWPEFYDRLQAARRAIGRPIVIRSGHRCAVHNARIGGAPLSQHLQLAVDITLRGHNPKQLESALRRAGFTGFGYYQIFLHVDLGRSRHWYGSEYARQLWQTF